MQASIIIPSYGRTEALSRCLKSLREQSVKPYEVIIRKEKGELATIRNAGARAAKGDILVFIDDDTFCTRDWLSNIIQIFETRDACGGSGPAIILSKHRKNRDLFRYEKLRDFYDSFFMEGRESLPGHFSRAGTWSTAASEKDCSYDGEVEFLEACNMSFRRDVFEQFGGFDEAYRGIGDCSEPDLCFRIRVDGGKLWFSKKAILYHEPSKDGAFKKRASDSPNRMANYLLFSKRWIKPYWKHTLLKLLMRGYYVFKTFK